MDIPVYSEMNSTTCSEKYNKNHFPEFYDMLMKIYPDADNFPERIYCYFNNIEKRPVCPICGGRVKYKNFKKGFSNYCSQSCCQKDPEYRDRCKQTCLERYGVEHASQSVLIRNKTKETCLERYGVENPSQLQEIRNKRKQTNIERFGEVNCMKLDEYKEKSKQTCLERYGVENASQLPEVREKVRITNFERYGGTGFASKTSREKYNQTCLERYGTTNINNVPEIKNKIIESTDTRVLSNNPDIIKIFNNNEGRRSYICKCPDPNCNKCKEKQYEIYSTTYSYRLGHGIPLCTIANPYNTIKNTTIELFIKNILDEYNIKYIENDRTILDGKELDIYIPNKNIAIECNGIFYHDEIHQSDRNYHYNKYIKCLNKDIQLLTIWEDWILLYPEKVKSLLLSKLGIYDIRIGARQCAIKEISSKDCSGFLNLYHIQGSCISSIRYGLYYNDELVSVMTFGKERNMFKHKASANKYELYRYCCKTGIQIIGGAERMLKTFIENYNPTYIESFSSNDISNGNLYKNLGFETDRKSTISYWYIEPRTHIRYHRYDFTKWKLVQEGYDKTLTEKEIMTQRGYLCIYDSGVTKWQLNIK